MASNNFTSFTITQPFLGAPLQFTPVLGSQELDQLIDAYVPGTASKSDKLSEVTIDFYNHATVDLNTGALVRTYTVFEQSPTQSQSSGFSPASSLNFTDSGYGSISMTPPARNRGGRVSKPKSAKKDTKKVAEARLPGFSIMTKDGIDVTSSAGRGTKTKEQREHAHLMRIMKACDDCKRKKVRCDPSHRRSDMSRTTSTTAKTSSSSRSSPPALSHSESTTSTGTFSAIDDFILFPEDASASASWDPTNIDADLSNFNFDINDMNLDIPLNNADFDLSAFDNMPPMELSQLSYEPSVQQHDVDQWLNLPISHSRPHPSASSQDSGLFDMNLQDSWVQALPDSVSHNRPHPSSSSQDSGQKSLFSTANVSPQSIGTLADDIWPFGLGHEGSSSQLYGRVQQPLSERSTPNRRTPANLQQSPSELSPTDGIASSLFFGHQRPLSENSPTDTSQLSLAGSSGSGSNASSRTSLQSDDSQYWTESTDKMKRGRESPAAALARRQLNSSGGSSSSGSGDHENGTDIRWRAGHFAEVQHPEGVVYQPSPGVPGGHARPRSSRSSLGVSNDIFGLANTCTLISESLRAVKQEPAACLSFADDLQRLRSVLIHCHSEHRSAAGIHSNTASKIHAFGQQLQGLSACIRQSQVYGSPMPQGVLHQTQVQAQLLLRSLCATINSLHTHTAESESSGPSSYQPLTSGRNLQLFVPASEGRDRDRHLQTLPDGGVESLYDGPLIAQDSRSTPPRSDYFAARLHEDEGRYALAFYKDVYDGAFAPGVGPMVSTWEVHDSPWNPVLAKQALSSLQQSVMETETQQPARKVPASGVRLDTSSLDEVGDMQRAMARTSLDQMVESRLIALIDPAEMVESTVTSHDPMLQHVEHSRQAVETPALDIASHYRVVVLATLASAVIATITRTASMLALALFVPLSVLLLSSPRQLHLAAPACVAVMALVGSGLFKTFQDSCQTWTSTNSLVSISRFALCAAIAAHPPSFLAYAKTVATLFSLLGSNNECGGAVVDMDSINSRESLSQNLRPTVRTERRRPQWLGMMDRLTAVSA